MLLNSVSPVSFQSKYKIQVSTLESAEKISDFNNLIDVFEKEQIPYTEQSDRIYGFGNANINWTIIANAHFKYDSLIETYCKNRDIKCEKIKED